MPRMSVVLMQDEELRCHAPDPEAGFGALSTEAGALPLKAVEVQAQVVGLLYRLRLRQTFVNVHGRHLEATYIFPLPDRAAVSRFRLKVQHRVVEGTLKERGEARREYNQAIARGHQAAIAEEDRPGVFTMRVGNIPPGESAHVELTLQGPLAFVEGEATFRFPLVVAPRYIPGAPLPGEAVGDGVAADTDAVPDASRISPPVLLQGWPSPVRLDLRVTLDPAGLPFYGVRSSLHTTLVDEDGAGCLTLRVAPGARLDRDFVLRFRVGEDAVGTGLVLHPDEGGGGEGTFALTLLPPLEQPGARRPRDLIFVLDRSGSMSGWKMVAARRAMARMVDTLTDADRFQVYAFDNTVESLPGVAAGTLVAGSDRQRYRAVEFLSRIEARGGTEMAGPLTDGVAVLRRAAPERDRVLVLVTDGQVGNEQQILRSIGGDLRQIRVFTLGIDRAVNEGFLRQLATLGGGACEIVESEDRLDEVMDRVHRQIGAPVLTGLQLAPRGFALVPGSLTPARLPDLFSGSPLVILGRYQGYREDTFGSLVVRGSDAGGRRSELQVEATIKEEPAIGRIWARGHLRDLEDRLATGAGGELRQEIIRTSLRFSVLCKFTAFVAVDREERVNPGGVQHRVNQAVEMPANWGRYDHPSDDRSDGEDDVTRSRVQTLGAAAIPVPRRPAGPAPAAAPAPGKPMASRADKPMAAAPLRRESTLAGGGWRAADTWEGPTGSGGVSSQAEAPFADDATAMPSFEDSAAELRSAPALDLAAAPMPSRAQAMAPAAPLHEQGQPRATGAMPATVSGMAPGAAPYEQARRARSGVPLMLLLLALILGAVLVYFLVWREPAATHPATSPAGAAPRDVPPAPAPRR